MTPSEALPHPAPVTHAPFTGFGGLCLETQGDFLEGILQLLEGNPEQQDLYRKMKAEYDRRTLPQAAV